MVVGSGAAGMFHLLVVMLLVFATTTVTATTALVRLVLDWLAVLVSEPRRREIASALVLVATVPQVGTSPAPRVYRRCDYSSNDIVGVYERYKEFHLLVTLLLALSI
jgi:hypothetical protein